MSRDYSPFTPGQPVALELFVGRQEEIRRLARSAEAAAHGQLQTLFIVGERGIGKSSLAAFVRTMAEHQFGMLGLHTFLGGVTSLEETVRRIFDRLVKESAGRSWFERIKQLFAEHIRQVDIFGVSIEFGPSSDELSYLVNGFVPALRNLLNQLGNETKGLFLVLDDINGLASHPPFASWLKSLVDEIATSQPRLPLCLVLVGLEERRYSLISNQPSLSRVFSIIDVRAWSEEETRQFFQRAFARVSVTVEEKAMDILTQYTGGLPVLAHEIGDATFNVDKDNRIDVRDAWAGVTAAAEVVGRKYVEPQVLQAIQSERYRQILREISREPLQDTFRVGELKPRLKEKEAKVLANFLRRMKELGVLVTDREHGRGAYRFANRLHLLYFCLEAERAKRTSRS